MTKKTFPPHVSPHSLLSSTKTREAVNCILQEWDFNVKPETKRRHGSSTTRGRVASLKLPIDLFFLQDFVLLCFFHQHEWVGYLRPSYSPEKSYPNINTQAHHNISCQATFTPVFLFNELKLLKDYGAQERHLKKKDWLFYSCTYLTLSSANGPCQVWLYGCCGRNHVNAAISTQYSLVGFNKQRL